MRNLFKQIKIKKELKSFQEFKKTYSFKMKEIEEKQDGSLYCEGEELRHGEDGEYVGETESLVNVCYKFHGPLPKVLSNLFQYEFYFKGFKVNSIECIFQGIKVKDKKAQRYMFKYWGFNSNNIKVASDYNWKDEKVLYFQGAPIDRNSKAYEDFVDEMYVSLLQNPLFRNVLLNVGDKYIMHAIGGTNRDETVFTRYEFEYELNALKDYTQNKYKK